MRYYETSARHTRRAGIRISRTSRTTELQYRIRQWTEIRSKITYRGRKRTITHFIITVLITSYLPHRRRAKLTTFYKVFTRSRTQTNITSIISSYYRRADHNRIPRTTTLYNNNSKYNIARILKVNRSKRRGLTRVSPNNLISSYCRKRANGPTDT